MIFAISVGVGLTRGNITRKMILGDCRQTLPELRIETSATKFNLDFPVKQSYNFITNFSIDTLSVLLLNMIKTLESNPKSLLSIFYHHSLSVFPLGQKKCYINY